ncbi:MAG: hypothetical protein V7647_2567, partial [Acidobacteriota bacterium]
VVRQFVFGGARVYGFTPAMAGLAAATGVFAVLLALRRGSES